MEFGRWFLLYNCKYGWISNIWNFEGIWGNGGKGSFLD